MIYLKTYKESKEDFDTFKRIEVWSKLRPYYNKYGSFELNVNITFKFGFEEDEVKDYIFTRNIKKIKYTSLDYIELHSTLTVIDKDGGTRSEEQVRNFRSCDNKSLNEVFKYIKNISNEDIISYIESNRMGLL